MFDLQVLGVILIVILFSLGSILLISKLPRAKTFDEMQEEKRQFKAQLLAASAQTATEKSGNNKKDNKNKTKKNQLPKKGKKSSAVIKTKPETEESADVDSDSQSDRSGPETSPVHTKKQRDINMDFIETEAFPIADHIPTKNSNKSKKNKKGGILVNKSDPILLSSEPVAEEVNHFEEIHPRDAIEIHRLHSMEENAEPALPPTSKVKSSKEKKGKKYTPPVSPVNQVKDNKLAEETAVADNPVPVKEKPMKKKKAEQITSSAPLVAAVQPNYDDDTVRALLRTLRTAELTRNEIQILIDFLLNKQHDTTAKDPTEWSEGKSDVLQKLKKQLQEKEKQLQDEQEASVAFQAKLRELRSEINAEKSTYNATIKAHIEELNNKKKELQDLSSEFHYLKEKHMAEKTALTQQMQQLQAKFIQLKNESGASQEAIQKFQQLTVQHEQLKQELIERNKVLPELQRIENEQRQFIDGLQKTLADRDQKLVEFERICLQKDEQLKFLDNKLRQETQVLRADLARKNEEFDVLRQSFEQLKHQLAEIQAKTANQNHVEDANKVEIKNLQNALDSSRKELNSYKTQFQEASHELNDFKQKSDKTSTETVMQITEMKTLIDNLKANLDEKEGKLDEYETLIKRLRLEQDELRNELEQQKTKNNDALEQASSSADAALKQEVIVQIVADEQNRTKEMLGNLLPQLPSNGPKEFNKWLEFTTSFIQKEINAAVSHTNNHSNKVNNSHNNDVANVNGSEEAISTSSSSSTVGDTNSCEVLLLQNAQLQKSLDEYKNIVADTEQVLRNLEAKVAERDTYWQGVVQSKEEEILGLKSSAQS
jgi:ribosome-binding protein 1